MPHYEPRSEAQFRGIYEALGTQNRQDKTRVRQGFWAKSNGYYGVNFSGFADSSFNPKPKMLT